MIFNAVYSARGSFIPILVSSAELNVYYSIFFRIDTGSSRTIISSNDIYTRIYYSSLNGTTELVGIGGSQEAYILRDVSFELSTEEGQTIEMRFGSTILLLPPVINIKTGTQIYIPSILGIDIIDRWSKLHYEANNVYLELEL